MGATAGSFEEQGTVTVDGTVLFKFAGGGQETESLRAGQFAVSGMGGAYAGLEGLMTTIAHETTVDLTVRVTVHME